MVKSSEREKHPLNVLIGVGGQGVRVIDSVAKALPAKDNFLIYGFDTHPLSPETGKPHKFVEYCQWPTPSERQLKELPIKVELNHAKSASQEAGGALRYRDYGRACFRWNSKSTIERIIKKGVEPYRKQHNPDFINYIIVATAGGGTGSGAVIDLAQSIKIVADGTTQRFSIDAFIVLPSGFVIRDEYGILMDATDEEGNDFAFKNAFALMLELREVIKGKRNPFHVVNLINSYSLGGWDNLDKALTQIVCDIYRGSLGESGNLFQGISAEVGFTTIIPGGIEFPLEFVRNYLGKHKELEIATRERDTQEAKLRNRLNAITSSLRKLVTDVNTAKKKIDDLEQFRRRFHLFKQVGILRRENELKEIFEGLLGTDRGGWDSLVARYEDHAKETLLNLFDTNRKLIESFLLTKTFLEEGRRQNVAIGKLVSKSMGPGTLSPFMDDCDNALKENEKLKELRKEVEQLSQEKSDLISALKSPTAINVMPVEEGWLASFEQGKVKLDDYTPPKGRKVLLNLLTILKGSEEEAERFYADEVERSLGNLIDAIRRAFGESLSNLGERLAYKYKLVVTTRPENYAPVKKLIKEKCADIPKVLGIQPGLEPQENDLSWANTYLTIYFLMGRLDLNHFQKEWSTCKEKYMDATFSADTDKLGEAHAWGMGKDEQIWTREHVGEVIAEVEGGAESKPKSKSKR